MTRAIGWLTLDDWEVSMLNFILDHYTKYFKKIDAQREKLQSPNAEK